MASDPELDGLIRSLESRHHGDASERLVAAVDLAEQLRGRADALLDHFILSARELGCSWADIGAVLGVTKQAAQQRFVVSSAATASGPPGLDEPAAAAFAAAADEARKLGHHYVAPQHLLFGLLGQPEELAARALDALGVTADRVRSLVVEQLGSSPPRPHGSLGVAPQTKRMLELAITIAKRLGHRCARTEHVLLAAISPSSNSSVAAILADCGADDLRLQEQLASMLEIEVPELARRLRQRPRRLRRRVRA